MVDIANIIAFFDDDRHCTFGLRVFLDKLIGGYDLACNRLPLGTFWGVKSWEAFDIIGNELLFERIVRKHFD